MPHTKKLCVFLMIATVITARSQDTVKTVKKAPERRHELGIGILTPLIFLTGAADYSERATNLSYRYFITERHAIKPFVGISSLDRFPENPRPVSATNTSTIYAMNMTTTPSNFQVGAGYEYIKGKKKLKHVIGVDLYYNNKFVREETSYYRVIDSTDLNGKTIQQTTPIDTGAYLKTSNYDKLGINLSYSLRYEISRKWVITASTIMTNKFYWQQTRHNTRSGTFDMNFVGLISDISLFYRF